MTLINIMIISLLIQLASNLFRKEKKNNVLACGIFGIVPKKGTTTHKDTVKLALLANEERGKHSTGIFTPKGSLKRTGSATEFIKNTTFNRSFGAEPILGHTRQPSVGANRGLDGAQPVIIYEKDDEKNPEFALVHNGTIYNMEELADQHKIEYDKSDTDSMILAKFLEDEVYEILEEYNGAASLLWWKKEDPKALYVFRGESRQFDYSKVTVYERPLNYGIINKGLYVSSTKEALEILASSEDERKTIESIPENKIFRIYDGRLEEIRKIDRSKQTQNKDYGKTYKTKSHNYGGEKKYDLYDDEYYGRHRFPAKKTTYKAKERKIRRDIKYDYTTPHVVSMFSEKDFKVLREETLNIYKLKANRVVFYRGLYRTQHTILDGIKHIEGDIIYYIDNSDKKQYAFIDGILLKDVELLGQARAAIYGLEQDTEEYAKAISKFAEQPVAYDEGVSEYDFEFFMINDDDQFTGHYRPKFTKRGIIEFYSGMFVASIMHPTTDVTVGDIVSFKSHGVTINGKVIGIDSKLANLTVQTKIGAKKFIKDTEIISIVTFKQTEEEKEKKVKIVKAYKDLRAVIIESKEELDSSLAEIEKYNEEPPQIAKTIVNLMKRAETEIKKLATDAD